MKLFPKEKKFYELFESSSENVLKAANLLKDLIDNYVDINAKIQKIKELEHQGDSYTHKTLERLNRTFITPLDREDIHSLISKMDDVLDFIDAASSRMALYKIESATEESKKLANVLVKSAEEMVKAIKELRNLKKPQAILNHCIEINRLENEADSLLRQAVAKLFDENADPIKVIKWKEIYENLETAIDRCEDVANVIEGVVLKGA